MSTISHKFKILCVVGTRPNFIKVSPLIKRIKKENIFKGLLVHTGQHYDYEMSGSFFKRMEIPEPDYNLNIKSNLHGEQTGKIMIEFEKICLKENPDLIIVLGDVNSTLAAALVAAKLNILLAHVESGLRSFDAAMPEEINRILTDRISDFLFVSESSGINNLKKEGIFSEKIFYVGNIMIDSLVNFKEKISHQKVFNQFNIKKNNYGVVTIHRPANVDNKRKLKRILNFLKKTSKKNPLVFPIHPRTLNNIKKFNIKIKNPNLFITDPLDYIKMISLISDSKFVITDSGGIQEETTFLDIPCFTLRDNTERPITIQKGTNTLIDLNNNQSLKKISSFLEKPRIRKRKDKIKFWDGKTTNRIIKIIKNYFYEKRNS